MEAVREGLLAQSDAEQVARAVYKPITGSSMRPLSRS
jgi:hypothetical protein